jgi:hypothetical protein
MQIGDRVSIKRKDSPVFATVTGVHAPSSFTVKYDQPQDVYDYREIPFSAIPESVQFVRQVGISTQAMIEELGYNPEQDG